MTMAAWPCCRCPCGLLLSLLVSSSLTAAWAWAVRGWPCAHKGKEASWAPQHSTAQLGHGCGSSVVELSPSSHGCSSYATKLSKGHFWEEKILKRWQKVVDEDEGTRREGEREVYWAKKEKKRKEREWYHVARKRNGGGASSLYEKRRVWGWMHKYIIKPPIDEYA